MSITLTTLLGKRIQVQRDAPSEVSGTIALPSANKDFKQNTGTVLMIGDEVTKVKVGDRILFPGFAGSDIVVDRIGAPIFVLNEPEVIGVISA